MGLQKEIILNNGLVLNYHRIVSLNKITNISNDIEVISYVSQDQRSKEARYQFLQKKSANDEQLTEAEQLELNNGINVFTDTEYISIPYDENMSIIEAYNYIKTLDEYVNSEDV